MRRNLAIAGLILLLIIVGFRQRGGIITPSALNASAVDDGVATVIPTHFRLLPSMCFRKLSTDPRKHYPPTFN
jgi:hypothetical protein